MKKLFLLFILSMAINTAYSQSAEDSVKAVINKMFAAMKGRNAASLEACFAESAILQTIGRDGKVTDENLKEFLKQIGSLPKDSADERISFDVVRVDNSLAIVWAPYQFYYAGKFSHCGVDSFQLVRINGVWKIQYLIDTRRITGCNLTPGPSPTKM